MLRLVLWSALIAFGMAGSGHAQQRCDQLTATLQSVSKQGDAFASRVQEIGSKMNGNGRMSVVALRQMEREVLKADALLARLRSVLNAAEKERCATRQDLREMREMLANGTKQMAAVLRLVRAAIDVGRYQ